jgi:hypothetical protein
MSSPTPAPPKPGPTAALTTAALTDGVAAGAVTPAALDALFAVLRPFARLAVNQGVQFGHLEELVKRSLVEAALHAVGEGGDQTPPISRLSVVTGIHRKEVKRLLEASDQATPAAELTPVAQLFTRWMTDPAWQTPDGQPRTLRRRALPDDIDGHHFEALARSVTTDVHPRTLLDELGRLALIEEDASGNSVRLKVNSFVPAGHLQGMLGFLGANVGDHLAAACANVAVSLRASLNPSDAPARPPFVEQALFADGLSEQSVASAIDDTRSHWAVLLQTMAPVLQSLEDADRSAGRVADRRIRIGLYCYAEPTAPASTTTDPDRNAP